MRDPTVLSMIIGVGVVFVVALVSLVMSKSTGDMAEARLAGLSGQNSRSREARRSGQRDPGPSRRDRHGYRFVLAPCGPQRREPQPPVRTGRRQFDVQNIHGNRGGAGGRGNHLRNRIWTTDLRGPAGAPVFGSLPFLWLLHRRKKRIKQFMDAMPEAVELMSRWLRCRARSGCRAPPGRRGDERPGRR